MLYKEYINAKDCCLCVCIVNIVKLLEFKNGFKAYSSFLMNIKHGFFIFNWIQLESVEGHDLKIAKKNQLVKKYGLKNARLIQNRNVLTGLTWIKLSKLCHPFRFRRCREFPSTLCHLFRSKLCHSGNKRNDFYLIAEKLNQGYDQKNLTTGKDGSNEEWIYSATHSSSYLYFGNDVLTKFRKYLQIIYRELSLSAFPGIILQGFERI